MRAHSNTSHSDITKEISNIDPTYRKYEMLKSYIYFYQKKLSLDRPNKHSDELILYNDFNLLYDGDRNN